VVDLSAQLKATLREQYEERFGRVVALDGQAEAERRGARLEALIFPSEIGGHIDEHNLRRRVWLPLLAAAELRHSRIHDLRHGYASLLIEAGAELQYVQGQLGHHSAAFTLRVYGHLLPRDRRGYVDRLDSGDQVAPSVGRTQSAG
jgi:integrase